MTPKEKAEELYNKFYQLSDSIEWTTDEETKQKAGKFNDELGSDVEKFWVEYAKQCAIIALDEIIESEPRYPNDVDWDDVGATHQYYYEAQREEALNYWKQVKQEIEKL